MDKREHRNIEISFQYFFCLFKNSLDRDLLSNYAMLRQQQLPLFIDRNNEIECLNPNQRIIAVPNMVSYKNNPHPMNQLMIYDHATPFNCQLLQSNDNIMSPSLPGV